MSSYVNIYVRDNDVFLPIGVFSRSSYIYRAFEHYVPYGALTPINGRTISDIKSELNNELKIYQNYINEREEAKVLVMTANNSLEDKLEAIDGLNDGINEFKDEVKYITDAINFVDMFTLIIDSAYYGVENYVYAGIECCPEYEDEVEIEGEGTVKVNHPSGKRG